MSFYKICPYCNAALDPGEKCDCREQKETERKVWENLVICGRDGQYTMNLNHRRTMNHE